MLCVKVSFLAIFISFSLPLLAGSKLIYHAGANVFIIVCVFIAFLPRRMRTYGSLVPLLSTPWSPRASTSVSLRWPDCPVALLISPSFRLPTKDSVSPSSEPLPTDAVRLWVVLSLKPKLEMDVAVRIPPPAPGPFSVALVIILVVLSIVVWVLRFVSNWGCQRNRTRTVPETPATPSNGIATSLAAKLSTISPRSVIPPEPSRG